ncbi:uncharacterized protein [Panulirus ornatus]|uniref:uncharacterized protein isoform X1 n=1 Tax=Panulirus ornatus TaxID=150431 RepID=UPI003A890F08
MISRMAKMTRKFIGVSSAVEDRIETKGEESHDPPLSQSDVLHYTPSASSHLSEYPGQCLTTKHQNANHAPPLPHGLHPSHSMPLSYHTVHATPQEPSSYLKHSDSLVVVPECDSQTEVIQMNDSYVDSAHCSGHNADTVPRTSSFCALKSAAVTPKYSPSEMALQSRFHDHGQLCMKNKDHWKKNVRKRLKNLGKAYTMQNGKEVKAKIFKPVTQCCSFKCFQTYGCKHQKSAFNAFWSMGDWNKQTKFLWDHINISETARKTANVISRRVHTRQFFLPNLQNTKTKVCKKMFLGVLQVSNGRLDYTLNQKIVHGVDELPKDKRGINIPANKTSKDAICEAERYIHSLPYNQDYQEKRAKTSVLQGVSIKDIYAAYKHSCSEAGKPLVSIKVFRTLIPVTERKLPFDTPISELKLKRSADRCEFPVQNIREQTAKDSCQISKERTASYKKVIQPQVTTNVEMSSKQLSEGTDMLAHTIYPEVSQKANNIQFRKSKERKLRKHKICKKLRDEGKSYLAQSGKIVWGKEFSPLHSCCISKCHHLIPVEQQEILFRKYWALGTWNLQTKFLWDHIEIRNTKAKTSKNIESRRVHTRLFFLPNYNGEMKRVCKVLFCSTLQISNGRLARAINQKAINPKSIPQDKRGRSSPHNKTPEEDTMFMWSHIKQLVQHQGSQADISKSYKLSLGTTVKKAHEMYSTSCLQHGRKPLCYTLFNQAVRKELESSLNGSFTSNHPH